MAASFAGRTATEPLAIAGGGIAGLATALALSNHDLEAIVLERANAPRELGTGLQLGPNAVRCLDRLGLGTALREVAVRPGALELRSADDGRLIAAMPLGEECERRHGAPYCVLSRTALHRILTSAARDAGVDIRYRSDVGDFDVGRGGVEIVPRGAPPVRGRALIGADGIGSRVRAIAVPGMAVRAASATAWRATVEAEPETKMKSTVTAWLAPGFHAVSYPIDRRGTVNLVVVAPARSPLGEEWDAPGDRQALAALTRSATRALGELIEAAPQWRAWPLRDAPEPAPPCLGPVTLLGDAAHPMLPYFAQGAAMAIEDAVVLGDALANDAALPEISFRRFERLRSSRLRRVMAASRRNGRIFHMSGLAAMARNLALRSSPADALLARFDWLYGGGPVAACRAGRAENPSQSGTS